MKWQQKTTVCFWDYLYMIITFGGILFPDSFFGEVSEKKISSGVSTFQRIRDVEFTRFNVKNSPRWSTSAACFTQFFFSRSPRQKEQFLEATKTKKILWFSGFRWLEVVKACRFEVWGGIHPPPPHKKKTGFDLLSIFFWRISKFNSF